MQSDDYDLAAPTFDLLELRSFRRDATLQYAVSQRSQQLRILFFSSSAVVAAAVPWISQELGIDRAFGAAGFIGCAAASVVFGALAAREKSLRGKVLVRLDRELSVGDLSIMQPGSAVGTGRQARALSAFRNKMRLVAVAGAPSTLLDEVRRAAVYKRRLAQSSVALVCVPFDEANDAAAAEWSKVSRLCEGQGWLWQPVDPPRWRAYYEEILRARDGSVKAAAADGAFFALSLRGRSCASAVGPVPWDELLGTKLPPLSHLSPAEPAAAAASADEEAVLAAQRRLYDALCTVDAAAVASLCVLVDDPEVTALGPPSGRLDSWETVLKYDATVGLRLSSQDATIGPDGQTAYSTGLEFPAGGGGSSLLCTQRWTRDADGAWLLSQHRTIPYTQDTDAAACLRCDHRGCVALQRTGQQGAAGMPGDGRA